MLIVRISVNSLYDNVGVLGTTTYEIRKSSQELHQRRAGSIEECRVLGRRQVVREP